MGSDNEVLIVIPCVEFQDAELKGVKEALSEASIGMKIAAVGANECRGVSGGYETPDYTLDDVDIDRFDGIIFIGGPGIESYLHDQSVQDLARGFLNSGKVVSAICWAVAILANAGVLKDKNATVWEGAKNDLEKGGGKYSKEPVVVDGNIITANGPDSAIKFGQAIANHLLELKI